MEKSEWNGYRRIDFLFEGRESVLICPTQPRSDGKWLFKTEYFGAFPKAEVELVKKGYHLFHLQSITRWHKDEDTEARARLWVSRLDNLFAKDLPFKKIGIAHLTCGLFNNKSREDYIATLNLIPEAELERVFSKAAELGVGIELNQYDMNWRNGEEDAVLRIYRAAKRMGCKFYLGTDAHHPDAFEKSKTIFERAIDKLELTEDDKFTF